MSQDKDMWALFRMWDEMLKHNLHPYCSSVILCACFIKCLTACPAASGYPVFAPGQMKYLRFRGKNYNTFSLEILGLCKLTLKMLSDHRNVVRESETLVYHHWMDCYDML